MRSGCAGTSHRRSRTRKIFGSLNSKSMQTNSVASEVLPGAINIPTDTAEKVSGHVCVSYAVNAVGDATAAWQTTHPMKRPLLFVALSVISEKMVTGTSCDRGDDR